MLAGHFNENEIAEDAKFKEEDHPRDDDGKFTSGGGASSKSEGKAEKVSERSQKILDKVNSDPYVKQAFENVLKQRGIDLDEVLKDEQRAPVALELIQLIAERDAEKERKKAGRKENRQVLKKDEENHKNAISSLQSVVGDSVKVNLDGVHSEFINAFIKPSLERMQNTYPMLKGEITEINSRERGKDVYASVEMRGRALSFNRKYAADKANFEKTWKKQVERGHFPQGCENPEALVTHEMAHVMDGALSRKMVPGSSGVDGIASKGIMEMAVMDVFGVDLHKISVSDRATLMAKNLSGYAADNSKKKDGHMEFFAEAFMEYVHNPNPRPLAKRVGAIIEEVLGKFKEA